MSEAKNKAKPTKQADTHDAPVEKAPVANTVRVRAKIPPFVDLIKDVKIGAEFVDVEHHEWLQAQIDAGLLIEE